MNTKLMRQPAPASTPSLVWFAPIDGEDNESYSRFISWMGRQDGSLQTVDDALAAAQFQWFERRKAREEAMRVVLKEAVRSQQREIAEATSEVVHSLAKRISRAVAVESSADTPEVAQQRSLAVSRAVKDLVLVAGLLNDMATGLDGTGPLISNQILSVSGGDGGSSKVGRAAAALDRIRGSADHGAS